VNPNGAREADGRNGRDEVEQRIPSASLLPSNRDAMDVAVGEGRVVEVPGRAGDQARREADLLELTGRCHPQTLRQIRWANTMIKTISPQTLFSRDS
jgi:hypothetical protein